MVLHYDGISWEYMESLGLIDFWDVWGNAPNNVVVVGGCSTVARYDGTTWSVRSGDCGWGSPIDPALLGVWVSPDGETFTVGEGGTSSPENGLMSATLASVWGR